MSMYMEEIDNIRKEVAYFMRRLYKKGLTTTLGGNISMRTEQGILLTPSSVDKARIKKSQIGLISPDGLNHTPHMKPSIESTLHLEIYRQRSDIRAVVHAHPPMASAFTAMQKEINCHLIAESRAVLGLPIISRYALMGSKALAGIVSEAARHTNVILLRNHGVVCLGKNLLSAINRLEILESAARMTIITSLLKDAIPLSDIQIQEIDELGL